MRLFVVVFSCLLSTCVLCQVAHNPVPFSTCKYSKNRCKGNPEGCSQCLACAQEAAKEKKAREAEAEKKYKAEAEKAGAANNAKKAVMDSEREAALRNNKSRDLLVNNAPSPAPKNNSPSKPSAGTEKPKQDKVWYPFSTARLVKGVVNRSGKYGTWFGEFYNEQGAMVLSDKAWRSADEVAIRSFSVDNVPDNFGIVYFRDTDQFPDEGCDYLRKSYGDVDLVTPTGQRLFNNKYLYDIKHIKKGWFLLSIDSSDVARKRKWCDQLFNIYTGQFVPLKRNFDWGTQSLFRCNGVVDADEYPAPFHFIPLFPGKEASTRERTLPAISIQVRNKIMGAPGSAVTNELLEKYAFVIYCQEAQWEEILTWDLATVYAKRPYRELLLVTNDGKVEWMQVQKQR